MSLRVAVIGCGSTGARRARVLRGLGIDTVLFVDGDPTRAAALADREGGRVAASTAAAASAADAALVCTPPASRGRVAQAAIRAGANVFVESPISDRLDGVSKLIDEANEGRRILMVGSRARFHPGMERIRALLEARSVGRAYAASMWLGTARAHERSHRNDAYAIRVPSFDAVQWFDALRWLFGNPVEVTAVAAKVYARGAEEEEVGGTIVRVESGTVVQVFPDRFRGPEATRIEIVGTDGEIHWAAAENQLALHRLGGRERRDEQIPIDASELEGAEMRHFLACVLTGRTPVSDGKEGRATLAMSLAVRRSLRLRRTLTVGENGRHSSARRGFSTTLRLVHAT